ncbi:MAG: hypothetical protein N4A44_00975 [Alphaproteobacteria bacterium]|jgi:hypothetical protein|nr:hypothetical protein [Alphaproteobacteria bacterium]
MIDTITIFLKETDFKITEYEAFNPSARGIFEYPYYKLSQGHYECYQNASARDKKEGIYKPQLTLSKKLMKDGKGYNIGLKVQFSAPKLLYGNNFDELENTDFKEVIDKLHKALKSMYVETTKEALKTSDLVAIHFGKNIILDNCPVSLITKSIAKMDISKKLDSNQTDFRNEGHSIKFRTNSYELTFYDKVKDLQQSKISDKKALEGDNYPQRDLFSKSQLDCLQVLRIEVRLNNKTLIRKALRDNGLNPQSIQINQLFNKVIAKRILTNFWDKYINPSLAVVVLAEDESKVLYQKLLNHGLNHSKAIKCLGALSLIKEEGIRNYKGLDKTYNRIKKDIEKIDFKNNYLYNTFKDVKSKIQSMNSLKLDNYKERL